MGNATNIMKVEYKISSFMISLVAFPYGIGKPTNLYAYRYKVIFSHHTSLQREREREKERERE